MCMCEHMCHDVHVEVKDYLKNRFSPGTMWVPAIASSNLWQMPLSTEPSSWPCLYEDSLKWTCRVKLLSQAEMLEAYMSHFILWELTFFFFLSWWIPVVLWKSRPGIRKPWVKALFFQLPKPPIRIWAFGSCLMDKKKTLFTCVHEDIYVHMSEDNLLWEVLDFLLVGGMISYCLLLHMPS